MIKAMWTVSYTIGMNLLIKTANKRIMRRDIHMPPRVYAFLTCLFASVVPRIREIPFFTAFTFNRALNMIDPSTKSNEAEYKDKISASGY